MPALNVLIWLSVKPIIKLVIPSGAGFMLTKSGLFTVAGSRAASQIVLNVTLPALLFGKIVSSLNPTNIAAIGPIVIVAILYQVLSLIMTVIIRAVFPTPRNFRWGIFAAAIFSNWGDLPTSVVATITLSAPFNGTADSNLAIAYVAIFILVFFVTLFPMRGTALIEWDYTRLPAIQEDEEKAQSKWNVKGISTRIQSFPSNLKRRGRNGVASTMGEDEMKGAEKDDSAAAFSELQRATSSRQPPPSGFDLRRVATARSVGSTVSVREQVGAAVAASFEDTAERAERGRRNSRKLEQRLAEAERTRLQTIVGSRAASVAGDDEITQVDSSGGETSVALPELKEGVMAGESAIEDEDEPQDDEEEKEGTKRGKSLDRGKSEERSKSRARKGSEEEGASAPRWKARLVSTARVARGILSPPTIALLSAIVIALVRPLQALFIVVSEGNFHPTAPDGEPPLAIIQDTATFIGAASVPLGLMVLGAALARMSIPRPFSRLPLASIISLAVAKLVILPVLGFLIVHGLTFHTNLVPPENKVLRFTLIYFSCVPTATTQVALTQIYAPEDGESNSDILAAYLIVQYAIFVISSVVLTAYTLSSF